MVELKDVSTQECEEKLRTNPASFIFSRLADCYRKRGDIQQAIEVCTRGLADHPDSITGRIILGRCFLEQEKYKEASLEFVKVIEQDRRNQVALKMLADIYSHQGMKEKAGDLYGFLLTIDPENQSIVNLAAAGNGSGLRNIYRILGFAAPEQPNGSLPAGSGAASNEDVFVSGETPAQPAGPFLDSQEAFTQTIQMDPDELKREAAQQETAFSRTMKFDTEELNPALPQEENGIEEIVGDLQAGGDASVTGDDISERMSAMFKEELPDTGVGSEPPLQSSEFHEPIDRENASPGVGGMLAPAAAPESMPEVSGSDISQRIEQLFGESASRESAAEIPASSGDYTQVFDSSSPRLEDAEFSGKESSPEDGERASAGPYTEQSDVSGEDIVSRMSEMFGKSGADIGQQEAIIEAEETLASVAEDAGQNASVSEAEETLANITENAGISAEVSESAISPDNESAADKAGIFESSAGSAASDLTGSLQDNAVSGDDIARRLETIFEEEEALSPVPPAVSSGEGKTDLDIKMALEPTASDTISFDDKMTASEPRQAFEANMVPDISSDDFKPFIEEMPAVDTGENADRVAADGGQAQEQMQEEIDESLDEALPAEEAPGMSGDDVRTRLDEIFPDALISEETLSMVEDIPDGEKNDEQPNQGFYTMSGEDAVGASSDEKLLKQLDDVEIEIPPLVKNFETASQELPETDGEPEASFVGAEAERQHGGPQFSGKPDEDRLNAIPDHVLTPTLADIYFQQGQPHLAVQIYERLLQKDPENDKIVKRLEKIKQVIADNPLMYSPVPDAPKVSEAPEKTAVRQPSKKPAPSKSGRKKPGAIPKPLAGVRIKKKRK